MITRYYETDCIMSKPIPEKRAKQICLSALRLGLPETARRFGIVKSRVHQIFSEHKFRVLFHYELYDDKGNERNLRELRHIFNSWSMD